MFRKTKDVTIRANEGFSVKVLGRAGLEYRENNKSMDIDSEMLGDSTAGFVVASDSIKRWKGSRQSINTKERTRIINNIKKFFDSQGYKIKSIRNFDTG